MDLANAPGGMPLPHSLGRYELLREIASGGMATVYLGRALGQAGFQRIVAIKCCHQHLVKEPGFASMFLDEARLAARIDHPNVVATLDVSGEGALYLVMEYVDGDRLLGLLQASGRVDVPIPVPVALRVAMDALAGLHAAHETRDSSGKLLEVVHRDISPHNILLSVHGITKITDFGIAKAVARLSETRSGETKGKLPYMAPEQFAGEALDRRCDVFAMGIVLWEMLANRRLFRGRNEAETMKLVLHSAAVAPSLHNPLVPPALDAVVIRALSREPADRYATAAAMSDALEACALPTASHRAVAACLEQMLGDSMEQRRVSFKRASRTSEHQVLPAVVHVPTAATSDRAAHDAAIERTVNERPSPSSADAGTMYRRGAAVPFDVTASAITAVTLSSVEVPRARGLKFAVVVSVLALALVAIVALRRTSDLDRRSDVVAAGPGVQTSSPQAAPTPQPRVLEPAPIGAYPDAAGSGPAHGDNVAAVIVAPSPVHVATPAHVRAPAAHRARRTRSHGPPASSDRVQAPPCENPDLCP